MYNYKSLLCTKYMLSWITSKIITHVQVYKHFIWKSDYIVTRGSWAIVPISATSITTPDNLALHHLQGLTCTFKKKSCEINVKWHIIWFCKIDQKIIFKKLENFSKYFWKVKLSGRFPMKHMRMFFHEKFMMHNCPYIHFKLYSKICNSLNKKLLYKYRNARVFLFISLIKL